MIYYFHEDEEKYEETEEEVSDNNLNNVLDLESLNLKYKNKSNYFLIQNINDII